MDFWLYLAEMFLQYTKFKIIFLYVIFIEDNVK